jgi:hypothetical protein
VLIELRTTKIRLEIVSTNLRLMAPGNTHKHHRSGGTGKDTGEVDDLDASERPLVSSDRVAAAADRNGIAGGARARSLCERADAESASEHFERGKTNV